MASLPKPNQTPTRQQCIREAGRVFANALAELASRGVVARDAA